jgi:hypothetical protein
MLGDLPPILYVLMFPWKCFFSTKSERRKQKVRVDYIRAGSCKGRFLYLYILLTFGNTLGFMPSSALP